MISNYAFSEIDRNEQNKYIEHIIKPSKNGYMTMNFIASFPTISGNELMEILLQNLKKGKIEKERPLTSPLNILLTWKPIISS